MAVYLRNYLRSLLNKSFENLTSAQIQHWIGLLFNALVSSNIEHPVKKHLCLSFETLLQVYQALEKSQDTVKDFYNKLFESVQHQLQQLAVGGHQESLKGVLLVCQAAMQNIRPLSHLTLLFPGISKLMHDLAQHYISILSNELSVISAFAPQQLTLENPSIQTIVNALNVLQEWANIHESILERYESKRYFAFHLFTGSQYYANVLT